MPGIPKAWKSLGKSSIQAGSAALIIYDLPNWTYELIIIIFGLVCWYGAKTAYHRIFGRKERNQLNELRSELTEARSKILILKEEKREAVEKAKEATKKEAKAKSVKNFSVKAEQPKTNKTLPEKPTKSEPGLVEPKPKPVRKKNKDKK